MSENETNMISEEERFRGRIDELKKLDTVIKQDNLKVDSKKYYKLNNR